MFARNACTAALLLLTLSCARAPSPPPPGEPAASRIARADAALRAGCYRCLEEAERLYASALDDREPLAATAQEGRLRALLLLAARVRELGLHETTWEEQAAAAAAASTDPLAAIRWDIVRRIRRPITAASMEALEAENRAAREGLDELTARVRADLLPRASVDPVDAYFVLALACDRVADLDVPSLPDSVAAVPLVAYRSGICSSDAVDRARLALDAEPRFQEIRARLGEHALNQGLLVTADRELRAALDAFPDLAMASLTLGTVSLLLDDPAEALAAFDRVLARVPEQPQAQLGRIRSLTALDRPEEAVAAADRLLAQGTWLQGEANYYRAWNLRQLRRFDEAAVAIAAAGKVLVNAAVPKLAGFIAWDRERFDEAQKELETSLERNDSDCEVLFALGQVHGRKADWPASAAFFLRAADCSAAAQEQIRGRLAEIATSQLDPTRRERLAARAERDLAAARRHEGLAAIQAAAGFLRAGRPAEACAPAERALQWEAHRDRALAILTAAGR